MPLQNRVTPFGEIVAIPERGLFTGNRGVLHDEHKQLGRRRWVLKAWLICLLEFKGRHREVMTPRRWTELFFFDEAVAIAAGHRPCYQCRYADFRRWQAAWSEAKGLSMPPRAPEMDVCLHAERIDPKTRLQQRWTAALDDLPPGTFIEVDGVPHLVQADGLRRWSWRGYDAPITRSASDVTVLTPPSSVAVLRAGYKPVLHASASL
ncbi:MAG: hypothetical protein GKS00_28710 [Alphaproteobacteria bacterium]|nr:hypothetical protein [Alphaproteobacteria bacterium]